MTHQDVVVILSRKQELLIIIACAVSWLCGYGAGWTDGTRKKK